jgi:hypothetical protein
MFSSCALPHEALDASHDAHIQHCMRACLTSPARIVVAAAPPYQHLSHPRKLTDVMLLLLVLPGKQAMHNTLTHEILPAGSVAAAAPPHQRLSHPQRSHSQT